ncbi:MAG: fatty acid desaturase [Actinomycetota bacterium]|nr:fatty acid desaturase [Actinomycetota bacterium]
MSRFQRNSNLVAVIVPFVAFAAAIVLLWNRIVGWHDLWILAVMYLLTGLGVTVGYHRMLTHRSFETYRPIRYVLAALGSMAVEGPAVTWVADHRKHHAFADEDGDPHSPHVDHGSGFRGAAKGLWHAHMGWIFRAQGRAEARRYAPDLLKERGLRNIDRAFFPLVGLGLAIPFGLGLAATGTLVGGLTALLWGGPVRIFLMHHATWSINSVCHFFGSREFKSKDHSTNVFWLALPSLGESWHNNHHAFPTSATHGLRWWQLDVSGMLIRGLERLGLAWNVRRPSPERQQAKALASA